MTSAVTVRAAEPHEVPIICELFGAHGWRDRGRLETLELIHRLPCGQIQVGEHRGRLVAALASLSFGRTGWNTAMAVEAPFRREGLGTELMRRALDWLRDAGARSAVGLTFEQHRSYFEAMGAGVDGEYVMGAAPSLSGTTPSEVRAFQPHDLEAACALDARATGEDRRTVLEAAVPFGGLVVEFGGEMHGFHLDCPWGPGPTIGADPMAGCALLDALRRSASGWTNVIVPRTNSAALDSLQGARWAFRLIRMPFWEPVPWRPDMVFGAFNFYWA